MPIQALCYVPSNSFVTMTYQHFMDIAIEEARQGDAPYGAVLVKDGTIIAQGFNTVKRSHDVTAHAEVNVIRAAIAQSPTRSLAGSTLYTTGEPCAMCTGAAIWARISRIVYGASVDQLAEVGQNQIGLSSEAIVGTSFWDVAVEGGLRASEILRLFEK